MFDPIDSKLIKARLDRPIIEGEVSAFERLFITIGERELSI
jgi:hypothetical protein